MNVNRRELIAAGTGITATLAATGAALAQNTAAGQTPETYKSYSSPATAEAQSGKLPDVEKKLDIVTLRDLEAEAQKVMVPFGFAYVAGGAGDEWTMRENRAAHDRWIIVPEYLAGYKTVDTTTSLLGSQLSYPVITAPMGNQGSVHARLEEPVVKGTALAGTLFVDSSLSQLNLEDIASLTTGPKWFQIYIPESRAFASEMLHRAKDAGYTAIVVTVDAEVFSNRERSTRLLGASMPKLMMGNAPKTPGVTGSATATMVAMGWDDIEFCRKESGLPVIVKSIVSAKQALDAERRGCAAVWLSNHGGRQIDNVSSAMTVLPAVASALNGRIPIVVDGGVFRGQDVFRALALGASAVGLGRPILYGSALGGSLGVQSVHEHLRKELTMVMQLSGTPTIDRITRDHIARAELEA